MSILDDAREGMNPDIRIQDDLFGHVNGTWLETAEIPGDRSSWGPFVMLADAAEQHVREIIESCADGAIEGDEARKIGDLFASFMDEERVEQLGHTPILPLLERIDALTDVSELGDFLGFFERRGGGGLFGSYVDSDDRNSERYIVNVVQGGIGLPDESYYREEKFAEIREKYLAYLSRILTLAERPDPDGTAARVLALETRIAKGHWERAETRDVIKSYNLTPISELKASLPSFDFDAWVTALGGSDETIAEAVVRQPSYLVHLEEVLSETPIEDWKAFLSVRAIRTAASYLSGAFVEANFDFYGRTLSGTPELRARWKRGVGLVEGALGEAVGREYVSRHFPPRSKEMMDELVGEPARGLPPLDHRPRLDERGDQAARVREAGHLPSEDRLPGEVPRLLRPRDHLRRPARQRAGGNGVRDRPRAAQDRVTGRPRRVVHAAADGERLLQPRHQRDLLPGRHPAAAVLRRRRRTGRELRRHRRRDRPRDRPRLRRPGCAVRRARQPQRLVDRRGQGSLRGEVQGADHAVRSLRAA